jgi:hypothetical protein
MSAAIAITRKDHDRVPMRGVTAVCPLSVPLEGQADQITISGKPMTGSSLRPAMGLSRSLLKLP